MTSCECEHCIDLISRKFWRRRDVIGRHCVILRQSVMTRQANRVDDTICPSSMAENRWRWLHSAVRLIIRKRKFEHRPITPTLLDDLHSPLVASASENHLQTLHTHLQVSASDRPAPDVPRTFKVNWSTGQRLRSQRGIPYQHNKAL